MDRVVAEVAAEGALLNLEQKQRAEAILVGPSKPRAIVTGLAVFGASIFAQFAFTDFSAPIITRALLVGMLAALVVTCIEIWVLRRRLEAVIQLLSLRSHEQA
jgi:hypothetical protein